MLLQQERQHKLNVTRVRIVLEVLAIVPLQLVAHAPLPLALLAALQMEPQRAILAQPIPTLPFRDLRVIVIALRVQPVRLGTRPLQEHLSAIHFRPANLPVNHRGNLR